MSSWSSDASYPLRRRSWSQRLAHGIGWRLERARSRLRHRFPPFFAIVREIRAVTGKGYAAVAADLLRTWRRRALRPAEFVALMFWEVPEERRGDYLVSRTLDPFLEKLLDPADLLLGRDKVAFAERDRAQGVPWLPTLAVVNRHEGPPAAGAIVVHRPVDLWPVLERLAGNRAVVLKPAYGLQGRGFFVVWPSGVAMDGDGRRVDEHDLTTGVFDYARRRTQYGYLVQPFLACHAQMVELTGVDALSTLRIVMARHRAGNLLLQAFLKIPAPGRLTDNFRRGGSGTFIAGVDPCTGRLGPLVGLVRPRCRYVIERTDVHPLTGKRIAGREIPLWRECLAVTERAAAAHPASPIFAWDVGLGPAGWVVLEGNPTWGPVGGQVCLREGLRPTLAELYPDYWSGPTAKP